MKKILALVVAFVLCFTAVAGCFTATAEDAVPTITIKDATAADGVIVIPVEGTNLQSVDSYLITIVLPADYTDIAVVGMEPAGDNGGDYAVKGTSVKILNEIEKLDTDNDGAIAFNVTAKVPAVEADRVDDVTATVDAGNADAQPVTVTVVAGKATLKAPVVGCQHTNVGEYALVDVTETFNYVATCSDCGEPMYKSIEIGDPYTGTINIGRSIEPANDISMFFKFMKTQISSYSDFVLKVTKDEYTAGVAEAGTKVTYDTNYEENTDEGTYFFTYKDLYAWDMNSSVDVELYGYSAELDKMILLKSSEDYSVYYYANNTLGKSTSSASLKKALVDLLNYGAAVQEFKNINVANLANAKLSAEYKALGTQTYCDANTDFDIITTKTQYPCTDYGQVKIGKSIIPESTLNMTMKLDLTSFTGNSSDLYIKFDYFDRKGNAAAPVILNVDENYYLDGGYKSVKFTKAPMSTLNYPVTITLYYGNPAEDGAVALTVTEYSIETYIDKYIGTGDAKLDKVLQTIYAYGYSLADFSGVPELTK